MSIFRLLAFASLFLTGCSSVFYQPSRMMYAQHPDQLDEIREELILKSADGTRLSAWLMKSRVKPVKGTVVQFHGNAQNLTAHYQILSWLVDQGYDFVTFDYRGYGISEGKPDQEGVNADALAAIRFALEHEGHRPKRVFLYGQSLGGAILARATQDLTAEERAGIAGVVIESSFSSYKKMASDVLSRSWVTWLFQPLGCVLVSNSYAPDEAIPGISPLPLLVLHGDEDKVVPFKFGEKIFSLAHEPKKFVRIPGGQHIDSMVREEGRYRPVLLDFLQSAQTAATR